MLRSNLEALARTIRRRKKDPGRSTDEWRRVEAALEQRLAFERLVADLSATFAKIRGDQVDEHIQTWLERVADLLAVDRITLFEHSEGSGSFRCVYRFAVAGVELPPEELDDTLFPAVLAAMKQGDPFQYAQVGEMPTENRAGSALLRSRSVLGLPLSLGGTALGGLVLVSIRAERAWADDVVQRLRVVAEIFANAIGRKRAEEERRVQQRLAEALEFRELVIGILGHDLRSPLSAVMGLTQLILRREALPTDVVRRVAAIEASAKRMNALIGTLLDFTESRFTGHLAIARTLIDLEQVCARAIEEQLAARPDQAIAFDSAGPVCGAWDPVRMAQLVSNLLSNATTYSDGGEPVRVFLRARDDGVTLAVRNSGAPISARTLKNLFEPFRCGLPADSSRPRSLGLGLYIVRQIVTSHEGTVDAESSIESGTTFTVRLPQTRSGA